MTTVKTHSIMTSLNSDQMRAVVTFDRPVLVLAGSGTGKTHLLTAKFLKALESGISPDRIMAVTFTRKAAQELKARIGKHLNKADINEYWIGTFHALSARILRSSPRLSPLGIDFTTVEQNEIEMIVAQILRFMRHESVNNERSLTRLIRDITQKIDKLKNDGLTIPDAIAANRFDLETAAILDAYEKYLRDRGNADYGDLILGVLKMMESPAAQVAWSKRFDVILVDEYQDINTAQGLWIEALVGPGTSLTCLGDDDQVIYQWRGANPDYILNFGSRYPNAEIVTLGTNYRSPKPIVEAAKKLIENNVSRYDKDVQAAANGGADTQIQVHAHGFADRHTELISTLHVESIAHEWHEMMVLTRNNAEAAQIAVELNKAGIPVNLIRPSAMDSDTMNLLSAWLRILKNPNDAPAFARCIGYAESDSAFRNLWTFSMMKSQPIVDAARDRVGSGKITDENIIRFLQAYDQLSSAISGLSPLDALHALFEHGGFLERLSEVQEDERLHFLTLFQNLAEHAQYLHEFSEIADLIQTQLPAYNKAEGVLVSTMHGVKGLEAPIVCSTGWSAKKFPRSLLDPDIEEQRRLAFVTVTRSSQRVHLFYDRAEGPSPFILEMNV